MDLSRQIKCIKAIAENGGKNSLICKNFLTDKKESILNKKVSFGFFLSVMCLDPTGLDFLEKEEREIINKWIFPDYEYKEFQKG